MRRKCEIGRVRDEARIELCGNGRELAVKLVPLPLQHLRLSICLLQRSLCFLQYATAVSRCKLQVVLAFWICNCGNTVELLHQLRPL